MRRSSLTCKGVRIRRRRLRRERSSPSAWTATSWSATSSPIGTDTASVGRPSCFAVNVAHSLHIRDEFVRSGVRAEHIDGSTPKARARRILARLASGETELVTNCMVLTEGWDMPEVGAVILARADEEDGPVPADGRSRAAAGAGQDQRDRARPQRRRVPPRLRRGSGRLDT